MADKEQSFRERLASAFAGRSLAGINPSADQALAALAALTISDALDKHGKALERAADSSDKYAGRLVWATWALVAATLALVYAAFHCK